MGFSATHLPQVNSKKSLQGSAVVLSEERTKFAASSGAGRSGGWEKRMSMEEKKPFQHSLGGATRRPRVELKQEEEEQDPALPLLSAAARRGDPPSRGQWVSGTRGRFITCRLSSLIVPRKQPNNKLTIIHQTVHRFWGFIGDGFWQLKVAANSGMLAMARFRRYLGSVCVSVRMVRTCESGREWEQRI